jgi:ATP-dependent DNA helicase RecQ
MNMQAARTALKKYFGYDHFRPLQEDIIKAVYEKRDTLVLMPTGGGKSVCYQIPAVTLEGVCVVVSPLISLMKDQVEALRANGIAAAFLNSSLTSSELQRVESDLLDGKLKLLYVSPEKIVSHGFLPLLNRLKISLFAIDEAHCISAWGHDFRLEYTQLSFLKKKFPHVPTIALTATADKVTRKDIIDQLQLGEAAAVYIASFDRPNLWLEVRPANKRIEQIIDFIREHKSQAGIIYCLSRKSTEETADKLALKGIKAVAYHAMLPPQLRAKVQEDFLNDRVQVVCATVAFGMGIDKSNVRWVMHYNLPKNLESYYQEIGRAGRDGAAADTILFYSYGDVAILRDFIDQGDGTNKEAQIAKLDRMMQYADARQCRRAVLLNYFNEPHEGKCGHCDICKNPPQYIDGTVIAQKALSAILRMKEEVSTGILIDVLRGSARKEILEKGYQNIKTYGAGREYGMVEWQNYIHQLMNAGLLEIAYDQQNALKLTAASKNVLFEGKMVQLVKPISIADRAETKQREQQAAKETAQQATQQHRRRQRNELFDILRQIRLKLSQEVGVPPYIIFSDATLEEMAAEMPTTYNAMMLVSGVGEKKMETYGQAFLDAIRIYVANNSPTIAPVAKAELGATLNVTHDLLLKGMTVEQIGEARNISPVTIYSHIAALYERGEAIQIMEYIDEKEIQAVQKAIDDLQMSDLTRLKPIYDFHEGTMQYHKIRLALSVMKTRRG